MGRGHRVGARVAHSSNEDLTMREPDPAFYDMWMEEHANRIWSDLVGRHLQALSRERKLPSSNLRSKPDRGTARAVPVSPLSRNRDKETEED